MRFEKQNAHHRTRLRRARPRYAFLTGGISALLGAWIGFELSVDTPATVAITALGGVVGLFAGVVFETLRGLLGR